MLGMLSVCDECLIVSGEISDISGAEADQSWFFFHFNPFFSSLEGEEGDERRRHGDGGWTVRRDSDDKK